MFIMHGSDVHTLIDLLESSLCWATVANAMQINCKLLGAVRPVGGHYLVEPGK